VPSSVCEDSRSAGSLCAHEALPRLSLPSRAACYPLVFGIACVAIGQAAAPLSLSTFDFRISFRRTLSQTLLSPYPVRPSLPSFHTALSLRPYSRRKRSIFRSPLGLLSHSISARVLALTPCICLCPASAA